MQDGDASAFRTAVITLQGVSESPRGLSQQPAACVPRVSDSVGLGVAPESGCLTSSPDAHAAGLRTTLGELLLWNNVFSDCGYKPGSPGDAVGASRDLPL